MRTVDTCVTLPYSPLIPAIRVFMETRPGEGLEIVMNNPEAFNDLKEFLVEQGIGFREIYEGERMSVQFTK